MKVGRLSQLRIGKAVTGLYHFATAMVFISSLTGYSLSDEPRAVPSRTVEEAFPGTASGILTHAKLVPLPGNTLLRAGAVEITTADLEKAIESAWYAPAEQLREFPFFVLEEEATSRILLSLARKEISQKTDAGRGLREVELVDAFLEKVTGKIEVPDAEIVSYYERIKEMVDMPLANIREQIRAEVEMEKSFAAVNEYVRSLGKQLEILVSESWVREQAKQATNNPVSRARVSGKPAVVAFSSGSCCGPDVTEPLLEELRKKYGERLSVVRVDARMEPLLMARHNIRMIPTFILYDSTGKEVERRFGDLKVEDVEKLIGKRPK